MGGNDAVMPPPYAHDLKSLETSNYEGFVSVEDTANMLEAYIIVIESFARRQHVCPWFLGSLLTLSVWRCGQNIGKNAEGQPPRLYNGPP